MINRVGRWSLMLGGLSLLAMVSGCGRSVYDEMLHKRTLEVRNAAKFAMLWGPATLPETPISIRVPQLFANSYVETSAHPEDGAKIAPERLQPPFLALPGFKLCHEAIVAGADGRLPCYCYLAAKQVVPGEIPRLEAQLLAELKKTYPDATPWEPADAATVSGTTVAWKRISATGDMPFRFLDAANGNRLTQKSFPGTFELWMHDAGEYAVLVGWRVPSSIEGPAAPNAPPGKPDKINLAVMPSLTAGTIAVER